LWPRDLFPQLNGYELLGDIIRGVQFKDRTKIAASVVPGICASQASPIDILRAT
jgi:hypothetical protein